MSVGSLGLSIPDFFRSRQEAPTRQSSEKHSLKPKSACSTTGHRLAEQLAGNFQRKERASNCLSERSTIGWVLLISINPTLLREMSGKRPPSGAMEYSTNPRRQTWLGTSWPQHPYYSSKGEIPSVRVMMSGFSIPAGDTSRVRQTNPSFR